MTIQPSMASPSLFALALFHQDNFLYPLPTYLRETVTYPSPFFQCLLYIASSQNVYLYHIRRVQNVRLPQYTVFIALCCSLIVGSSFCSELNPSKAPNGSLRGIGVSWGCLVSGVIG